MRILTYLGLFLIAGGAFARGGAGDVFADALFEISRVAIVIGAILGVIHGCASRMSWHWLFVPVLGGSLLSTLYPIFSTPLLAIGCAGTATSALVSDIVRRGFVRAVRPEAATERSWPSRCFAAGRRLLVWLATTYVFWLLLAVFSSQVLAILVFAPIYWQLASEVRDYLPFLLPPLLVALGVAAIGNGLYFWGWKGRGGRGYLAPILFNTLFAAAFLIASDIYRAKLMEIELQGRKPVNFQSVSFVAALIAPHSYYRAPHASFSEGGKSYIWSYRERRFVAW